MHEMYTALENEVCCNASMAGGREMARSDPLLCQHEDLSSKSFALVFKIGEGLGMTTYGRGDLKIPKSCWSPSPVKTVNLRLVQ